MQMHTTFQFTMNKIRKFTNSFRGTLNKIRHTRFMNVSCSYNKEHKSAKWVLLFSTFLAIIGLLAIKEYFIFSPTRSSLSIFYERDTISINNVTMTLDIKEQILTLGVGYVKQNSDSSGNIIINASSNLDLASSASYYSPTKITVMDQNQYSAAIDETDYMVVKFIGNFIEDNQSELNMELNFNTAYTSDYQIPLNVTVMGIQDIIIDTIYPQPSIQRPWILLFKPGDFLDSEVYKGIIIKGIDREKITRSQYIIFIAGIVLGIAFSIISQILMDFVSYLDKNWIEKTANES